MPWWSRRSRRRPARIRPRLATRLDGAGAGAAATARSTAASGMTSAVGRRPSTRLSFADNTPDARPARIARTHSPRRAGQRGLLSQGRADVFTPARRKPGRHTRGTGGRPDAGPLLGENHLPDPGLPHRRGRHPSAGQPARPGTASQRSLRISQPGQSHCSPTSWTGYPRSLRALTAAANPRARRGPHPALDGGLRHLRPSHRRSVGANAVDRRNPVPPPRPSQIAAA